MSRGRPTTSGHQRGSSEDLLYKLRKSLPVGMDDVIEAMSPEEVRSRILRSNETIRQTNLNMEEDQQLRAAKEVLEEYKLPYKEVKKAQVAIIQYSLHVLASQGESPNVGDDEDSD